MLASPLRSFRHAISVALFPSNRLNETSTCTFRSSQVFSEQRTLRLQIMPPPSATTALLFDVFGTVVDWRSSITNGLISEAKAALDSAQSSIPSRVRLRATSMSLEEWGLFAQEWRNSYMKYTRSRASDPTLPVATIDEHHLDALYSLLRSWGLEGLWSAEQVQAISLLWHRLVPWPDAQSGLKTLSVKYPTCTLSNGNFSLLQDLKRFGQLEFTHIFSAEEFGTFKPNPRIYLGAAAKLGVAPSQCALVAAHLGDLKAAKGCGYATIYVERPREEAWTTKDIEQAKQEGWVDVWITEGEGGFTALETRLGDSTKAPGTTA